MGALAGRGERRYPRPADSGSALDQRLGEPRVKLSSKPGRASIPREARGRWILSVAVIVVSSALGQLFLGNGLIGFIAGWGVLLVIYWLQPKERETKRDASRGCELLRLLIDADSAEGTEAYSVSSVHFSASAVSTLATRADGVLYPSLPDPTAWSSYRNSYAYG
jgi:hypothetical protein